MTEPTLLRTTVPMRRLNDLIWDSLDHDRTSPFAFFCECAQDGCYRPVWLTPVEYAEGRRRRGWTAVAASHQERLTA